MDHSAFVVTYPFLGASISLGEQRGSVLEFWVSIVYNYKDSAAGPLCRKASLASFRERGRGKDEEHNVYVYIQPGAKEYNYLILQGRAISVCAVKCVFGLLDEVPGMEIWLEASSVRCILWECLGRV